MAQAPLAYNVPIVNKDGTPSAEFLRKWQEQINVNATIQSLSTSTAVSAVLDLITPAPGSLLLRTSISWSGLAPPGDAKRFLNGAASPSFAQVKDTDLSFTDTTANNASTSAHGFLPKLSGSASQLLNGAGAWAAIPTGLPASPSDATKFLNGAATPTFAQVKDSDLSTSDVATNNVSTAKHGFVPKAPGVSTQYLDGTGAWSTPAGGGGGSTSVNTIAATVYTISNTDLAGTVFDVFTGSGAVNVTLPVGLSGSGPLTFVQGGTAPVILSPASGVTVYSVNGYTALNQAYTRATLVRSAANTYYLFGDLAPTPVGPGVSLWMTTQRAYAILGAQGSGLSVKMQRAYAILGAQGSGLSVKSQRAYVILTP